MADTDLGMETVALCNLIKRYLSGTIHSSKRQIEDLKCFDTDFRIRGTGPSLLASHTVKTETLGDLAANYTINIDCILRNAMKIIFSVRNSVQEPQKGLIETAITKSIV